MATSPAFNQTVQPWWSSLMNSDGSCYKPSSDHGLQIVCAVQDIGVSDDIVIQSRIFSHYSSCCPTGSQNSWEITRICSPTCWTNDTSVAEQWNSCVVNVTATLKEEQPDEAPRGKPRTDCTKVDYDVLYKAMGLKKSGANSNKQTGTSLSVLLAGMTAFAVLVVTDV